MLVSMLLGSSVDAVTNDPVADYLRLQNTPEFIVYRSDRQYYADDKVFQITADLNTDGIDEVLVSSTLDVDGQQGNVFYVYKRTVNGFDIAGQMHLHPNQFYLGQIDELNAYGIVKFWRAGGGEGGLTAYVFDGERVVERALGAVTRDPATLQLRGADLRDKYADAAANAPNAARVTVLAASDIAAQYGVAVSPQTYLESTQGSPSNSTASPAARPDQPGKHRPPGASSSVTPEQAPAFTANATTPVPAAQQRRPVLAWAVGFLALSCFLVFIIFKARRR